MGAVQGSMDQCFASLCTMHAVSFSFAGTAVVVVLSPFTLWTGGHRRVRAKGLRGIREGAARRTDRVSALRVRLGVGAQRLWVFEHSGNSATACLPVSCLVGCGTDSNCSPQWCSAQRNVVHCDVYNPVRMSMCVVGCESCTNVGGCESHVRLVSQQNETSKLDQYGYDSYYISSRRLLKLNGAEWQDMCVA